jgi:hypothetical protein
VAGSERRKSQESECCAHAEGTRFYCVDGQVRNCCTLQARIIGRALRLRSIFLRIVRASRSVGGVRNSIKLTRGNLGGLTLALTFISPPQPPPKLGPKIGARKQHLFGFLSTTFYHFFALRWNPLSTPSIFPPMKYKNRSSPQAASSPCTSPSLYHGSTIILIAALL